MDLKIIRRCVGTGMVGGGRLSHGIFYGIAIAVTIRSLDHSLFIRLIAMGSLSHSLSVRLISFDPALQESRGGGDLLICDLELVGYKHQIKNVDKPVAIYIQFRLVRSKSLRH